MHIIGLLTSLCWLSGLLKLMFFATSGDLTTLGTSEARRSSGGLVFSRSKSAQCSRLFLRSCNSDVTLGGVAACRGSCLARKSFVKSRLAQGHPSLQWVAPTPSMRCFDLRHRALSPWHGCLGLLGKVYHSGLHPLSSRMQDQKRRCDDKIL